MNTVHSTDGESDAAWEASVSTWVDGEADIRADELDSPYGRQVWDTYHLIGDVMRSRDLAIRPTDRFYARVSAAIDAEPVVLAPAAVPHRGMLRLGLSGLAVAAAVASVVWIARPALLGADEAPSQSAPVLAQAQPAAVPTDAGDPGLADYMAAHRAIVGVGPVHQVSFDRMGTP
ncbi:sigma-E factor negative regulatory protein [Castellaniella sp. GW247-6E4]|uniref:sigma-E factor negative regulatory protein n=1 Tax=Castellaniella sp. GW247-6E4 TaxID=3140380 RepID=UPI00331623C8